MARLPVINANRVSGPDGELQDPVPLAGRSRIGQPGWLSDRQGRKLRYLRLSVTDRCDLKCQYCMPAEGIPASPRQDVLTFEEIVRVCKIFKALGVQTVRLTGGEPLVRKNLDDLVRRNQRPRHRRHRHDVQRDRPSSVGEAPGRCGPDPHQYLARQRRSRHLSRNDPGRRPRPGHRRYRRHPRCGHRNRKDQQRRGPRPQSSAAGATSSIGPGTEISFLGSSS